MISSFIPLYFKWVWFKKMHSLREIFIVHDLLNVCNYQLRRKKKIQEWDRNPYSILELVLFPLMHWRICFGSMDKNNNFMYFDLVTLHYNSNLCNFFHCCVAGLGEGNDGLLYAKCEFRITSFFNLMWILICSKNCCAVLMRYPKFNIVVNGGFITSIECHVSLAKT